MLSTPNSNANITTFSSRYSESKSKNWVANSLFNLLKEDKYPDIKYGIKFGYKNIGFNGKFYTFPYFLAFLLKRFIAERK